MKTFLLAAVCLSALSVAFVAKPKPAKTRLYEIRVYHAEPGKLNDLLTRFRNHSTKLLEKHGMTNEGYWLPIDNKDNKLIYVMSYPDRAARDKSWKDFQDDPAWQKVRDESEKNGKLITRVEEIFLQTTDFSPKKIAKKGTAGRVFELRTYKATANNLPNLLARFRNHTVKLFEKHGMTNLWYWTYAPGQTGSEDMLVYILSHPSQEAGKAAFDKFRQDPDWQKVRADSEKNAGGSLTVSVESLYMVPTDFSPVK